MISFGLRFAFAGGREAVVRLATIAAAVALGVGMLLATVAGLNAVSAQSDRYAWLNTSAMSASTQPNGVDATIWNLQEDYFQGDPIARLDVAATGPTSPAPPGIRALPQAGEYYASPRLAELISTHPAAQLADRYPGRLVGTIGVAGLPSPDSLIAIVGHRPADMGAYPNAVRVTHISDVVPQDCSGCVVGLRADGFQLVLSVVIGALLFPVLIFIGAATRLTAARREQRFAAMRLVGATPRQISTIAAAEMTAAAALGTAAGFGLFYALRNSIASIPFTGQAFFPSDLTLGVPAIVAIAVGIPIAGALAARFSLRRVRVSPLGVARRSTPRPPGPWRLVVAPLGLAFLASFLVVGVPHTSVRQIEVFMPGIATVMIGLVLAGPWLTMMTARALARHSRRPAALIAARRLADNPGAAFRAISGLVVALFVTTVAVGILTTLDANRGSALTGTSQTVMAQTFYGQEPTAPPPNVLDQLARVPGVRAAMVVRANQTDSHGRYLEGNEDGLIACTDLAKDPTLGHCEPGAEVAYVDSGFTPWGRAVAAHTVWATAPLTPAQLQTMPIASIVADTDGTRASLEATRTILDKAFPNAPQPAATADDQASDYTKTSVGFRRLAYTVSLASLPIAGCSLAVSVATGLIERKRPFSLLRLAGVSLRMLRRVVAFESVLPLLLVAMLAIGLGLVSAQLFLKAQMQYTLSPPGLSYYGVVALGLAVSLAIIGSTFPLLTRMTGPEVARND